MTVPPNADYGAGDEWLAVIEAGLCPECGSAPCLEFCDCAFCARRRDDVSPNDGSGA
jgi:hypothetical protein